MEQEGSRSSAGFSWFLLLHCSSQTSSRFSLDCVTSAFSIGDSRLEKNKVNQTPGVYYATAIR